MRNFFDAVKWPIGIVGAVALLFYACLSLVLNSNGDCVDTVANAVRYDNDNGVTNSIIIAKAKEVSQDNFISTRECSAFKDVMNSEYERRGMQNLHYDIANPKKGTE